MKQLRSEISFPAWLLPLFRPFVVCGWWQEELADEAANAIEDEQYEIGRMIINRMVAQDGESSETVRLSVRIDRYQLLGCDNEEA
jgi:hypothetical protein